MLTFSLSSTPAFAALPITCCEEPAVVAADHEARRLAAGEARIEVLRVARTLDGVDHADGAFLHQPRRHALLRRSEQRRLRAARARPQSCPSGRVPRDPRRCRGRRTRRGAVRLPPAIVAPPGCGNADCSVTVCVPAPNAGSPTTCSCHDCGTHIGAGHRERFDLRVLQAGRLELVHRPLDGVHEGRRRRTASPHLVARAEALEREPDNLL